MQELDTKYIDNKKIEKYVLKHSGEFFKKDKLIKYKSNDKIVKYLTKEKKQYELYQKTFTCNSKTLFWDFPKNITGFKEDLDSSYNHQFKHFYRNLIITSSKIIKQNNIYIEVKDAEYYGLGKYDYIIRLKLNGKKHEINTHPSNSPIEWFYDTVQIRRELIKYGKENLAKEEPKKYKMNFNF